ncbi:hypothetical protein ROZALSC1DRAFT_31585, partial [Rozella allomycis CSF55]
QVLQEKLQNAKYQPELATQWTKEIADGVKLKIKDLGLERYKIIVNVVLGEQKSEGVRYITIE